MFKIYGGFSGNSSGHGFHKHMVSVQSQINYTPPSASWAGVLLLMPNSDPNNSMLQRFIGPDLQLFSFAAIVAHLTHLLTGVLRCFSAQHSNKVFESIPKEFGLFWITGILDEWVEVPVFWLKWPTSTNAFSHVKITVCYHGNTIRSIYRSSALQTHWHPEFLCLYIDICICICI